MNALVEDHSTFYRKDPIWPDRVLVCQRLRQQRPVKVCPGEVRPAEVRRAEVHPFEERQGVVFTGDVRKGEVHPFEVCVAEVRLTKVCSFEARVAEVRQSEVCPGKVGTVEVRPWLDRVAIYLYDNHAKSQLVHSCGCLGDADQRDGLGWSNRLGVLTCEGVWRARRDSNS